MLKLIAWNIARRSEAWRLLAASDADVALLQEAKEPPADVTERISVNPGPWHTGATRHWRAAVAKLSNRVAIEFLDSKPLGETHADEIGLSRLGTLAAAVVTPTSGAPVIVISVYGSWENPLGLSGSDYSYADASVHRLISDMSVFASKKGSHATLWSPAISISSMVTVRTAILTGQLDIRQCSAG